MQPQKVRRVTNPRKGMKEATSRAIIDNDDSSDDNATPATTNSTSITAQPQVAKKQAKVMVTI